MDTVQIIKCMKNNIATKKYFKGVFASDKLPTMKLKKPACLIINTDPSTKPGMHWVAIFLPHRGLAEYFDSFGLRPKLKTILKCLSNNGNAHTYTYNKKQLQNIFSVVCGNYCCEYLLHRCQGKSKNIFFKKFSSDTTNNDKLVMNQFNIHFMKNRVPRKTNRK